MRKGVTMGGGYPVSPVTSSGSKMPFLCRLGIHRYRKSEHFSLFASTTRTYRCRRCRTTKKIVELG